MVEYNPTRSLGKLADNSSGEDQYVSADNTSPEPRWKTYLEYNALLWMTIGL
ncbi:C6 finger domain protein [Aspergillus luchuensis]|uniref:C6 finger domain protein n=1 Tax=Aspergillus kawachii TaxID=1069201 RepID=A0A146FJP4_ASPKA|nr:C6 finger domain protein [Aspergillus luchuensis]